MVRLHTRAHKYFLITGSTKLASHNSLLCAFDTEENYIKSDGKLIPDTNSESQTRHLPRLKQTAMSSLPNIVADLEIGSVQTGV